MEHGAETARRAVDGLRAAFGDAILGQATFRGEETLFIDPARLVEVGRWLKESPDFAFVYLVDIMATHWLEREYQHEVAYLLYSFKHNSILRLKVRPAGGGDRVPTVTGVWRTADWHEREEWDKVGVVFTGHPNLKRILMPEDWEGHPLRKDYPMEGIGA
ncbi:MAG TPA: NADH-quinone oxidoreductase subunit C [Candidatus Polarisedimenticolia bacterium]|jgi:NADH-quinone oxidoreductase subunit C